MQKATVAGGCFWCMESTFSGHEGVVSTTCGYTAGSTAYPNYEEVCQGDTGHYEAIEIQFDPERITFLQLLDIFWHHIDPFDSGGQFADRGVQYQTVIFYHDVKQQLLAEKSKASIENLFGKPVATCILPAQPFYPAEEFHQGYCFKNPEKYQSYQSGHCSHLKKLWEGKLYQTEDLQEKLTPLQYHVTQEEGTEPPFKNEYWDNKKEGIYVDIISGEPLFSSRDKYDSGTGWPSFTQPIDPVCIEQKDDWSLGTHRVEVRSRRTHAHLGHVFPDGSSPTGLRYCMNSAALRFIPQSKLKEEGYEL